MKEWPEHGGNPLKIMQRYDMGEKKVMDFSANLNPLGPPPDLSLAAAFRTLDVYPDPDYRSEVQELADALLVEPDMIRLTNGGAEAIFLVAHLFAGKSALIIEPAFSEYARACEAYQIDVTRLNLKEDFGFPVQEVLTAIPQTDLLFLCRPNNPTGTIIPIDPLIQMLEEAEKSEVTVVVDEAFVHFLPLEEQNILPLMERFPNLIILRSLTKIYAVPGLRLGYIVAQPEQIKRVAGVQIPWSVNGVVASLLPDLLARTDYIHKTRRFVQEERERLVISLHELGFTVSPSVSNFYLLKDASAANSDPLFVYLVKNGIIPRHTHTFSGLEGMYIRLAVRKKEENDRLLEVLAAWKGQ
ncbi:threonine-phosphate decarboxylase [Bacillus sp. SB49]|uniref:threonine-phosphate decarboxylase CobD n=1 Tax=Bacillus sp. SB49 TaxID=1071080 RepID=UPI00041DF4CF|nr:threonine-phosphate decarboxylase CobD [Bacillus sp. SB49]QHT45646.1 threonine-phosphate decarboxylase [Bacillus sp. SB49]